MTTTISTISLMNDVNDVFAIRIHMTVDLNETRPNKPQRGEQNREKEKELNEFACHKNVFGSVYYVNKCIIFFCYCSAVAHFNLRLSLHLIFNYPDFLFPFP